jgi:glycosyltransferase involved in cell wall biosynthesis
MRARLQLGADRVHVVYNGILLDGYAPAARPPAEPALGYLARLCPVKGLRTLVDAYLLLRERGRVPGLKLRAAGTMTASDAPFVEEMRARCEAAGVGDDVAFTPNISREEKIAFLQGVSVFSVPAIYGESFGLYVIEALAAGVPVVQPRPAAFPELLEITSGGRLCAPGDYCSLADWLEALLRDTKSAREMGARGRQAVLERFSVERMGAGALRVFESAVSSMSRCTS